MHSIWAVAKNTIAQAVRMKVAAVVFLLLLILLPIMSVILSGDGTLVGKLQSFSSYGISLVSFLLSLLTVIVSCYTLSTDLQRRTLDLVLTKPIARYQIVLGKFLGVALLNLFLLVGFACIVYGLTLAIPGLTEADDLQRAQADAEFFTARKIVRAEVNQETILRRADERLAKLQKEGQISEGTSVMKARATLLAQERQAEKSVAVAAAREWDFEGINLDRSDPNAVLFVRFKFQAVPEPANSEIYGLWQIGDFRQFTTGIQQQKTPVYRIPRQDTARNVHEFVVSAAAVAEDGHVMVGFFNSPEFNFSTVIFDQIELLYKVGSFGTNFTRIVLLIAIRLVFLAALGVSLGTWLSFPVASLVGLFIFFSGLVNGFFVESIENLGAVAGTIYTFTIRPLLYVIPRFDGPYSPTDYIVTGHVLPWSFLIKAAVVTIGIQMLLLVAAGVWIFRRREIAKITV